MAKGRHDLRTREGHVVQLEDIVSNEDADLDDRLRAMKQLQELLGIKPLDDGADYTRMSHEQLVKRLKALVVPVIESHVQPAPAEKEEPVALLA